MRPELRFVAACCRWPADDYQRTQLEELQPLVTDWGAVTGLAEAHRIEGLVWRAVEFAGIAVPAATAAKLKAMSEEVRSASLRSIAETLRIVRRLNDAGVEHRIIKGLPVAVAAYGSSVIKNSVDIDLLVRPQDVVRTAALLSEIGYTCVSPPRPLDEQTFELIAPIGKEACLFSERNQVDLHWALVNQPDLLRGVDPWAACREVELLPAHAVATLSDAENLAYLAAHGASSGWSRLKWLADFSAFLSARAPAEQEMLCKLARRATGGRIVDQGLILVERLFGPGLVPAPERRDARASQRLAQIALQIVEARHPGAMLENTWASRLALSRSRWMLRKGAAFRIREAVRAVRRQEAHVRLRWPLPRGLHWMYIVLGPFSLLAGLTGFIRRATVKFEG